MINECYAGQRVSVYFLMPQGGKNKHDATVLEPGQHGNAVIRSDDGSFPDVCISIERLFPRS